MGKFVQFLAVTLKKLEVKNSFSSISLFYGSYLQSGLRFFALQTKWNVSDDCEYSDQYKNTTSTDQYRKIL